MSVNSENLKADLVVMGGGGAGLAAALAAAEKGCKNIVVLEKAGSPGGSTAMAHDIFGAESPVQKRSGVDARRDDLFKVAMEWAHWTKINPRIVRAFIDKSGDTIAWLEGKNLEFAIAQFYPGQVPWVRHYIVKGQGAELMRVLRKHCEDSGVKIFTHARANKILRNVKGNITGVEAQTKNGHLTIAAKSVIVATGGCGNNPEMLKKYCDYYHDNMTYDGVPSNTGDGTIMATEIGAGTAGLGAANLHSPFLSRRESPAMPIDATAHDGTQLKVRIGELAWEPYTIWINKKGKRYVDEAYNLAFFAYGNIAALQPEGVTYSIIDNTTLELMEGQGLVRSGIFGIHTLHGFVPPGIPLPGLKKAVQKKEATENNLKIAESLDEIAKWIGCEPSSLKSTLGEYNADCNRGHDTLFAKDQEYLRPFNNPPYYAIRSHIAICEAYGGIKVNENMEVLDTKDRPIPGLYAAGSATGGWESEAYCYRLTGHLVGFALNSGRIAAENAFKYISG